MVKVSVLALRQAAQVQEVQSVEEALEALRKLWKEDEGVRKLLEEAARHGYTLVQTKDVEPAFVAAVRTALAKLRERLGEEKPSTLRVKYDPKRKEERSKPKPSP
jgi:type VI protein secretion system component VasK